MEPILSNALYMCDPEMGMKNIEFNTIAISIGGIVAGVRKVHNVVSEKMRVFYRDGLHWSC